MFLGHWYLNTPSMELAPLKTLIRWMIAAIALRMLLALTGVILESQVASPDTTWWIFVGFRWIAGLIATMVLAVLTWYALLVPNTQSATGILYAAVVLAFIGELTSLLLSANSRFPV